AYRPLSIALFHAAFVGCWLELSEDAQSHLVRSLKQVMCNKNVPPDILQTLLNLAEFMDHEVEGEALPIDIRLLSNLAERCHAYAKALHYKEIEFGMNPARCIESLIAINKKVGQPEAAKGILTYAQTTLGSQVSVKDDWLAKLGSWEEAIILYRQRHEADPTDTGAILGCMKCMDAMGEWGDLVSLCNSSWDHIHTVGGDPAVARKAATMAARATWSMGDWAHFEQFVGFTEENVVEGAYLRAVLALRKDDLEQCTRFVNHARQLLDNTFTTLIGESYKRAYNSMVMVQQLAELEEIVDIKRSVSALSKTSTFGPSGSDAPRAPAGQTPGTKGGGPNAQKLWKRLRKTWKQRLAVSVMQRILMLRGLVLTPEEDIEAWLQFASLCRVKKNYRIAKKVLDAPVGLASGNESYDNDDGLGVGGDLTGELRQQLYQPTRRSLPIKHKLMFAWVKQRKAQSMMGEALKDLSRLAEELSEEENSLKVKCLLKRGNWELSLVPPSKPLPVPVRDRVFTAFKKATELEEDNYKAWHHWAMVNFRVVELAMQEASMSRGGHRFRPGPGRGSGRLHGRQTEQERKAFTERLVSAARGFMRAIMLGKKKWSALVQQLIACMNHKDKVCREALHKLLMRLGEKHPQALVNPLSVALKSPKENRKAAAEKLMQHMVLNSNFLVKVREALLVSTELIRVAILWHEQWHEGLEEASRLYHGDHNIPAMLKFVEPLHKELEKGASTAKEDSFQQKAYGKELSQAWASIKKYQAIMEPGHNPEGARLHGGALNHLNQAWNLYYDVFRKINKHLPQVNLNKNKIILP
ncbi:unnamed protein product, partial [Ectocarpus sp. 12 AP-2014]